MIAVAFVVAAAALALLRSVITERFNTSAFPTGTLVVNVSGSFVAAVLSGAVPGRWQSVTGVAAAGAFTTFSTFAVEVAALWEDQRRAVAGAYGALTAGAAVGAAFIALAL